MLYGIKTITTTPALNECREKIFWVGNESKYWIAKIMLEDARESDRRLAKEFEDEYGYRTQACRRWYEIVTKEE